MTEYLLVGRFSGIHAGHIGLMKPVVTDPANRLTIILGSQQQVRTQRDPFPAERIIGQLSMILSDSEMSRINFHTLSDGDDYHDFALFCSRIDALLPGNKYTLVVPKKDLATGTYLDALTTFSGKIVHSEAVEITGDFHGTTVRDFIFNPMGIGEEAMLRILDGFTGSRDPTVSLADVLTMIRPGKGWELVALDNYKTVTGLPERMARSILFQADEYIRLVREYFLIKALENVPAVEERVTSNFVVTRKVDVAGSETTQVLLHRVTEGIGTGSLMLLRNDPLTRRSNEKVSLRLRVNQGSEGGRPLIAHERGDYETLMIQLEDPQYKITLTEQLEWHDLRNNCVSEMTRRQMYTGVHAMLTSVLNEN